MQLGMVILCLLAASEHSKKGKTCQRHDRITITFNQREDDIGRQMSFT